jgi:hypothetical protein
LIVPVAAVAETVVVSLMFGNVELICEDDPPNVTAPVKAGDVLRTTLPVPVEVFTPVPPLATGSVPVSVLLASGIVLLVTVCVFVAVRTLDGVMIEDRSAIA